VVVVDISISSVLVSVLLSVADEVLVDVLGVEVALELDRRHLLVTVDEEGWGSFDLLALGVLANNLPASLESDIDVTELDLLVLDGLDSSQLLPLDREFLASAASGVDIGNDPDVLNIPDDHLLKGILLHLVGSVPEAVVATVAVVLRDVLARLGEVLLLHGAGSVVTILVVVGSVAIEAVVVAVARCCCTVAVAAVASLVAVAAIVGTLSTVAIAVAVAVATVVAVAVAIAVAIVTAVAIAIAVAVAIAISTIVGSSSVSVAVAVAAASSVAALGIAVTVAVAAVRLSGARPSRVRKGSDQGKSTDI